MDTTTHHSTTVDELSRLANIIDRHGLGGALPGALERLARRAEAAGVSPTLTGVLVDDQAPEPARARAFGRIHRLLAGGAATERPSPLAA